MLERLPEASTRAPQIDDTEARASGAARAERRRALRSALPYFIVAAVFVPLLFFGLAVLRDWRSIEAEGLERAVLIRDAIAEHAIRVFKTHELVADSIRDRIDSLAWNEIAASPELHDYLARIEADIPEIHAIWLVDGTGRLRASSRSFPAEEVDVRDREWFESLREGGSAIVIGPRQMGRIHRDDFFTITVPRRDETADFDGLIRISVSPGYFHDFYATAYPDDGLIALVRADGEVLVAYPPTAGMPSRVPDASPFMRRGPDDIEVVFRERTIFDGRDRIQSWTRLGDLPVYASFATDVGVLEERWFRQLGGYLVFVVPAMAALILLAGLARRSHRELEAKVELRTRALSEAVAEKNQLLKEVHHRVKNNMQIVSSLIRMQERVETSPEETIRRVQAMALVHDLIYSHGEFASVNLGAYARRLGETLLPVAVGDRPIEIRYDLDHVAVTLDRAMPFALILSEVVTNSLDHAFPDGRGHIEIGLSRVDGRAVLRVADSGPGFETAHVRERFGLKLVRSLAVQLEANVHWEHDDGCVFTMEFPLEAKSVAR